MKNRDLLFFLLVISLFSCNKEVNYFDFDEVHYYKLQFEDIQSLIKEIPEPTTKQKLQTEVILEYLPNTIFDTLWIDKLTDIDFKKQEILKVDFLEIDRIFSKKKELEFNDYLENMCQPVFRDILIFRKKNKTIGIGKICFQCDLNHIIGTNIETYSFGYFNEYENLKQLLNNYK